MNEADIYLRWDNEQKIEIEFPENFMDDISYEYDRGNYSIKNDVTCKWRKEDYAPKFYLSLPYVKRIDLYDYSNVYCLDTIRYNQIKFYSLSTGDIHLLVNMNNLIIQSDYIADITVNGKVEKLSLWYKNVGRFYGQNLESKNVVVEHHGENDLNINPLLSLDAKLFNVGNIKTYHNPNELKVDQESTGKLIFIE